MPKEKKELSVLGIEIKEDKICMAQITKSSGKVTLNDYIILYFPKAGSSEALFLEIRRALSNISSQIIQKNNYIYLIISGKDVVVREMTLPLMDEKDLGDAVKWEIKNHINFPVDNAVIDYQILGQRQDMGIKKFDILAGAIDKNILYNYLSIFKAAKIKLDGISIHPFSISNLLKQLGILLNDQVSASIDISENQTNISFFKGNNVQFYRQISLGGEQMTRDIIGVDGKTPPILRRLTAEINRSFDYFREQFSQSKIDKIFVTGSESSIKNLDAYLSSALASQVEVLNILNGIELGQPLINSDKIKDDLPQITAAIGLALSQSKEINLLKKGGLKNGFRLPFNLDKMLQKSQGNSMQIIGSLLIILIILISSVLLNISLNKTINASKKDIESKKSLRDDIKLLLQTKAEVEKIAKDRTQVSRIIVELFKIVPRSVNILNLSYNNSTKMFSFAGTADKMSSIGAALQNIGLSRFFSGASLLEAKKGIALPADGNTKIEFRITAKSNI